MKKKFGNLNILEKGNSSQNTRMDTEKAYIKISDHTILDTPDLIALNKPSGLLSIPDREGKDISLKKLLIEKYDNIFTVHRLDKDTSGLIVFAKNETTHKLLSQQFEERQFQIHTGRTHQIRVHAKHIGHPVVCDELYGDGKPILLSTLKHKFKLSKNELEERPILNRLALHALSLQFTNTNGEKIKLEAPVPKDLRALLQQLRKRK